MHAMASGETMAAGLSVHAYNTPGKILNQALPSEKG